MIKYEKFQLLGNCRFLVDVDTKSRHRRALFECMFCKRPFEASVHHVKAKSINHCGCIRTIEHHGYSTTPLYEVWTAMKQRCTNPNHPKFISYGKRGITVCKEWHVFTAFKEWADKAGYAPDLTLDRIDNNKGYTPNNCRWATKATQQANRRPTKSNKSGAYGIELTRQGKFTPRLMVEGKRISLGVFSTLIDAINARNTYIITNSLPHTLSVLPHSKD